MKEIVKQQRLDRYVQALLSGGCTNRYAAVEEALRVIEVVDQYLENSEGPMDSVEGRFLDDVKEGT